MMRNKSILLKAAAVLCVLFVVSAAACAQDAAFKLIGSYVTFGRYEQDDDLLNGPEPIEWRVLTTDGRKSLLLSRYVLDAKRFDEGKSEVYWADSTLRQWLNSDFMDAAFTEAEKTAIIESSLTTPANNYYGTVGGAATTDRVFLLSINDVGSYLTRAEYFVVDATLYAQAQGITTELDETTGRMGADWWTRSPSQEMYRGQNRSEKISPYEYVKEIRPGSTTGNFFNGIKSPVNISGVVPAIWLDLTADVVVNPPEEAVKSPIVSFGSYEQDNDPENGTEPVLWVRLAEDGGKTLLVSRYALDAVPYNNENAEVTWSTSSIRDWLNHDFLDAVFTEEEQTAVLETTRSNPGSAKYGTEGGEDTVDRIFLLSLDEAETYLANEKSRMCAPTDYAAAQGVLTREKYLTVQRPAGQWWLRTPGDAGVYAAFVMTGGSFNEQGFNVTSDKIGVRPAFWADTESEVFLAESAAAAEAAEEQSDGDETSRVTKGGADGFTPIYADALASALIRYLPSGSPVELTGDVQVNNGLQWVKVTCGNVTGWIRADHLQ